MYLKELTIFGFKSFPEKTLLTFGPGITVVVGPNGCGKSNVFDAIKWALGEQSPKSLRGAKMEDIIFNGTQTQPPLNYSEVTLTFCNADGYLPIDYKEVAIGRRLYRSGESQYFINKNAVRLRDVQELLMGTGIGEATYSFIEQGKIEIFLSYKPEDKRLIFDEASGIIKYKERRKETYRKLQEADDNLLRLDDILSEVRRQIRYLERQVSKAKKYKQLQEELIEVEKKIATLQMNRLRSSITQGQNELNQLQGHHTEKDSQLQQESLQLEEAQEKLRAIHRTLEETTTAIVSLGAQSESATNNIVVYEQRLRELRERNVYLEQSKRELSERLQIEEQRHEQEIKRLEAIQQDVAAATEAITNINAKKTGCQNDIEEAKKIITQEKSAILHLEDKRVTLHNAVIETQAVLSSLLNRKKRLSLDAARLDALLRENKDKYEISEKQTSSAENSVRLLQAQQTTLNGRLTEFGTLEENIRGVLIDKEKELLELNATFEFLKDFRLKYETFSITKNVTVIFDEEPKNINKLVASLQDVEFRQEGGSFRADIEAKVVSFEEEQLEEKMRIAQTAITGFQTKIQELKTQKVQMNESLSAQSAVLEGEKIKLQECLKEKEGFEREAVRLAEEVELIEQEKKVTLADMDDAQGKQKQLEAELAVCDEQLQSSQEKLSQFQERIATTGERIKEIDIESTRLTGEIQSLHKEKETLSSKVSFFQDELNMVRNNLEQIDKEKNDNATNSISLQEQIQTLTHRISENTRSAQEHEGSKVALEQEDEAFNQQVSEIEERIGQRKKESQELQTLIYDKRLEVQSVEYEKEKITDYLSQVYSITFEPVPQEDIHQTLDDFTVEKERLQKRMKSLGEVNLVAIEEFEELKQRNDFLESQKQDLITSKENLKKAIQKINRTSRQLFMETFEKIQEEFKKNYRYLFNGGRANLILLEPDNILESGVEIEVQPPGKKLQNVSLLSGGEKSLTATALIFAIFRVRPSPLCVLDEIDAPLDEANVDRFNTLLKEFSSFSQFVLITHNKKTMSNADVLYGVTMQERGISKLVSVKFASEAEEAPVTI